VAKVTKLPVELISERYFTPVEKRAPFVQTASLFEDLVIRIVRYAFAYIPPEVGRVFFSKLVAVPFIAFREFRHWSFFQPGYSWRAESGVSEPSFHAM
jgi:hypothetical protein